MIMPKFVRNALFVIPIFNDWISFRRLVADIDTALGAIPAKDGPTASVIAINDGSIEADDESLWRDCAFDHIESIEVVDLMCNLGHQRAIAIGLSLAADRKTDAVIVMDGDGEDDPADLPRLIEAYAASDKGIAMAHRAQRSEGTSFKIFYSLYKLLFRWLTGLSLSFGNYCVLSPNAVRRLIHERNLWNSLPATCIRSRLPYDLVSTKRGRRYDGVSQMNFVSLLLHGLQAIAVFSDAVLVRLVVGLFGAGIVASIAIVMMRFLTDWVPLGWASNMLAFIWAGMVLICFVLLSTILLSLQGRSTMPFIPKVQGPTFIEGIRKLLDRPRA